MKEVVLITGANGLIAKKLAKNLSNTYSIRLLTRKKNKENEFEWNVAQHQVDERALKGVHHIIHLAGANIAEKRWTQKRKKEIISSRINSAHLLKETLLRHKTKVKTFISASAVGYYGAVTTQNIYTEIAPKGTDFLSDVVQQWEDAADMFITEQVAERVIKLRTGVVLSESGGALAKMKLPIQYYLGASIGKGNQYIPWAHIEDVCAIYKYCIQNTNINGVYNIASPVHITNKQLTHAIANSLQKPVFLSNIPEFIIKLLFGKASVILLKGSRVSSDKIQQEGFHFKYPELDAALLNLLK